MANLSSVIKSEITRLARKEIKAATDPLRKTSAVYRREIAELKRNVASLRREIKTHARPVRAEKDVAKKTRNVRFSTRGLKTLRVRLGVSAADFGRLIGASGQSIYNWESGKAVPRASQQAAILAVRVLGKREAARRLGIVD